MNGWIKFYRSLRDHPLWRETPFTRALAWIDLLLRANFTETRIPSPGRTGNDILGPGELIFSLRGLQKSWGWSRNRVLRFLAYLKSEGMIQITNETIFSRLRILNWKKYQLDQKEIEASGVIPGGGSVDDERTESGSKSEPEAEPPFQQEKRHKAEPHAEPPTEPGSEPPTEPIIRREEGQQPQEDKKEPSVAFTSHVDAKPSGTPEGAPDGKGLGFVVVVPEGTGTALEGEDRERLLALPAPQHAVLMLKEIGVGERIAAALAATYPIGRVYDVSEAAKKQTNPGGWARKALEENWVVGAANGPVLDSLLLDLSRQDARRLDRWASMGNLIQKAPDRPTRRADESQRDYFARVNEWVISRKPAANAGLGACLPREDSCPSPAGPMQSEGGR